MMTYEYHCGTNCIFSDLNLIASFKQDFNYEFHPNQLGKLVTDPNDDDDDDSFKFKNLKLLPKLDKKGRDDTTVFFTSRSDAKNFIVKNRDLFNNLIMDIKIKKVKGDGDKKRKRDVPPETD